MEGLVAEPRIRRSSTVLRERLRWRYGAPRADRDVDRGMVARTLAYLFGFGALLLLATLLLPDSAERQTLELIAVAGVAIVACAVLIIGYDRLPLGLLRAAPFVGTVLVGFAIYYSDPADSAAYAMYMAWVVVSASLFMEPRLILIHGVLAVAVYAGALVAQDAPIAELGVPIAMMTGTVMAIAFVMAGIGMHVRRSMGRLESAAHTDPLTRLPNRRAFDDAFARELGRAERTGAPLGIVIIDLDGFKRFNDERGHQEGDRALRRVGLVLDEKTRAVDLTARIGGEEFALLVPDCDTSGGLALAERLRRAVEVEFGGDGSLTASCGVSSHPADGDSASTLIAAADRALYMAKRQGRNRVVGAGQLAPDLRMVEGGR